MTAVSRLRQAADQLKQAVDEGSWSTRATGEGTGVVPAGGGDGRAAFERRFDAFEERVFARLERQEVALRECAEALSRMREKPALDEADLARVAAVFHRETAAEPPSPAVGGAKFVGGLVLGLVAGLAGAVALDAWAVELWAGLGL
jgi:hypothetical protein